MILDLTIVSPTVSSTMDLLTNFFLASLCKQFKLERPSTEKLNSKHLDGVFGML